MSTRGEQRSGYAQRGFWQSRAVRWAAVYLCAAAALLSIAGTEFSGPSDEQRARHVESATAGELRSAVTTAADVAETWAAAEDRRRARKDAALETALASASAWTRRVLVSAGDEPDFAASAGELAGILHDDMSLSVISTDGTPLFVAGLETDLDRAMLEPVQRGYTVAVAWAQAECAEADRAQVALRTALLAGLPAGTGLYFVDAKGDEVANVSPRPVPGAARARPLGALGSLGFTTDVAGDLETGRLVTVRGPARDGTWTVVGERFLTPAELAAGERGTLGMVALAGMGLLAAAAFTHALRSGTARRASDDDHSPARLPVRREHAATAAVNPLSVAPIAQRQVSAAVVREPDVVPPGNSILRLRQACGETGTGPDLAACARSPILRALAHSLRSDAPQPLPREVRDWANAA
jgi:hypothetical protein